MKSWHENGNLKSIQQFNKYGIEIGTSYQYYEDGQIELISIFEDKNRRERYPSRGKKNGWQQWFHPNGQIRTALHFSNGKIDKDYVREYYPSGQLKAEGTIDVHYPYSSPIIIKKGLWKHYYENGLLFSQGEFTPTYYTQCCPSGPCQIYYSYKSGLWVYLHSNETLVGSGMYFNYQDHIRTSCGVGDVKTYSKTTADWIIKSNDGNIESSDYLNRSVITIENARADFY